MAEHGGRAKQDGPCNDRDICLGKTDRSLDNHMPQKQMISMWALPNCYPMSYPSPCQLMPMFNTRRLSYVGVNTVFASVEGEVSEDPDREADGLRSLLSAGDWVSGVVTCEGRSLNRSWNRRSM